MMSREDMYLSFGTAQKHPSMSKQAQDRYASKGDILDTFAVDHHVLCKSLHADTPADGGR